ncbi:hypothetical protein [Desulfofustis glycolicus]|uniref:Uncharacterized protein n=1 Tax=Desulfofustis glycolicus DSM 9705 TaxID=1121409 RepID=A0A1M5V084_9BACT|nr:hypothetical protein [Desulfofustis glycolicus]MCB2215986.1 hypothetical protein [Desulfobulbaceae bacterium]SHH68672.1 hypothetical protein SAMN02745124_01447 [Desulfofustis glycolicus DSM 9705]
MARQTQYDLDTLRTLVNSGKSKADIMTEMNIKNHPTFNNLMLKLMDTDKKYYRVKSSRRTKSVKNPVVKIGRRNTLTLSAKNLEDSGFGPGDSFTVSFSKKKISLTLQEK